MATTNWALADAFQAEYPHTFNALQKLVAAMAAYQKNCGKRTLFGKDKGLESYKQFEGTLRDTLLAMTMDEAIERNADPTEGREMLIEMIGTFSQTFPNWQDAYAFADEYFIKDAAIAEDRIRDLLRQ